MDRFALATGFCLLAFSACGEGADQPCLTKNAIRAEDGVCECPTGTHVEVSTCVPDAAVDKAPSASADGGKGKPSSEFDAGRMDAAGSRDTGDAADGSREDQQPQEDPALPDAALQTDAAVQQVGDAQVAARPGADAAPACTPVPETCDGKDEDCDGTADNGAKNDCGKPCDATCPPPTPSCTPTAEECDGKDNDCDGTVDDIAPEACSAGVGACERQGAYECRSKAKVCTAVAAAAAAQDICGDGKDNNCDDTVDNGKNECGMACGSTCPPPPPVCTPGPEMCDGKDNDCDGKIDEEGTTWYRDCDGDGFAASADGSVSACTQPAPTSACPGWTVKKPEPGSADCNDDSTLYRPGAPYSLLLDTARQAMFPAAAIATSSYCASGRFFPKPEYACAEGTSADFNCDGKLEPLPASEGGTYWESSSVSEAPFKVPCTSATDCDCYTPSSSAGALPGVGLVCGKEPYISFNFCAADGVTQTGSTEWRTSVLLCR